MGKKKEPTLCCLQETHISFKGTYTVKEMNEKIYSMQMETKRKQG